MAGSLCIVSKFALCIHLLKTPVLLPGSCDGRPRPPNQSINKVGAASLLFRDNCSNRKANPPSPCADHMSQLSIFSLESQERASPVLTVCQLTAQIKTALESRFDDIAVIGEVSNAKVYPSGHWYFSLKDQEATLPCVCFRNSNAGIKFQLEDGLMVVARGKLSVYPPRGAYQMVATTLEPVGVGEYQLAFDQLKQKLDGEGLLSAERKRPIPLLPRKVGVVTSPAGAALRDILTALARRNSNVSVVISPTRVQGEGSAEEIAQAIAALQELDDIEVMLVARGGGSIEDLWSFNSEVVARAVALSRIPVISGVGHETDVTICDLVADLRAPTPTAASELVARGRQELLERWANVSEKLANRLRERLVSARRRLERCDIRRVLRNYDERLRRLEANLRRQKDAIQLSMDALLRLSANRWRSAHERLFALGPANVMRRGYSILRTDDGTVVRDATSLSPGQELEALLERGRLRLRVESIEEEWY